MNSGVQERLQEDDIVKAMKTQRLQWYGHVRKMREEKVVNKVTEWKRDFRRARGRPNNRWEEDIKRLRIHNWRGKIQDRESWMRITEEAKTSKALEWERRKMWSNSLQIKSSKAGIERLLSHQECTNTNNWTEFVENCMRWRTITHCHRRRRDYFQTELHVEAQAQLGQLWNKLQLWIGNNSKI